MSDFSDKLNSLLALQQAKGTIHDPDEMSSILESLASGLAFTAALAGQGDPARISHLLEGLTGYIFETAAQRAPLAKLIVQARAMKP